MTKEENRLENVRSWLDRLNLTQVEVYTAMGEKQANFNAAMRGRNDKLLVAVCQWLIDNYDEVPESDFFPDRESWRETMENKINSLLSDIEKLETQNEKSQETIELLATLLQKIIEASTKLQNNQERYQKLLEKKLDQILKK